MNSVDNSRELADPDDYSVEVTSCGPNADQVLNPDRTTVLAEPNTVVLVEFEVTNRDSEHRYFDYDVYFSSQDNPEDKIRDGDISLEPGESGSVFAIRSLPDGWEGQDFQCRVEIRHSLLDDVPQLNQDG